MIIEILKQLSSLFTRKGIMVFYLCLFFFSLTYSQSQSETDSDCKSNIENIFKVHALKIKYEAVVSLYQELDIRDSIIRNKQSTLYSSKFSWNEYFRVITGSPLCVEKSNRDSLSNPGEIKAVSKMSKEEKSLYFISSSEEVDQYLKQLNYTPDEAFREYKDFVWNILTEKEIYLKCIDSELAKGDSSEYAKGIVHPYNFRPSWQSFHIPPGYISKLDYLKIFKEFVLNDNQPVLPEGLRVIAYLKCNCKIP